MLVERAPSVSQALSVAFRPVPATVTSAVVCGGRRWTMRQHVCRLFDCTGYGARYGCGIGGPAEGAPGHAGMDPNVPVGFVRFRMVAKHNWLPALAVANNALAGIYEPKVQYIYYLPRGALVVPLPWGEPICS